MTIAESFKSVGMKVYELLEHCAEARDDDRLLLSIIWGGEVNASGDFLEALQDGTLSHPETIRRIRQKLQEEYPPLRGKKWALRHKLEAKYVEQLTFFEYWSK